MERDLRNYNKKPSTTQTFYKKPGTKESAGPRGGIRVWGGGRRGGGEGKTPEEESQKISKKKEGRSSSIWESPALPVYCEERPGGKRLNSDALLKRKSKIQYSTLGRAVGSYPVGQPNRRLGEHRNEGG